jgi:hypothetical protein
MFINEQAIAFLNGYLAKTAEEDPFASRPKAESKERDEMNASLKSDMDGLRMRKATGLKSVAYKEPVAPPPPPATRPTRPEDDYSKQLASFNTQQKQDMDGLRLQKSLGMPSPTARQVAAKAKPAGTMLASQTQNQPERI